MDASTATHEPGSKTPKPTPAQAACGDVAGVVKEHLNAPEVTDVTVDGQCTGVVVKTKLADDDAMQSANAAKELCDKAAEVAYVDDVQSVNVIAAAGRELSAGIKGRDCIAEP